MASPALPLTELVVLQRAAATVARLIRTCASPARPRVKSSAFSSSIGEVAVVLHASIARLDNDRPYSPSSSWLAPSTWL